MYRALLSDYEVRQQALMQENAELKKLLQYMKKDMVSILSPKTHCSRAEDSLDQVSVCAHRLLWMSSLRIFAIFQNIVCVCFR